MKKENTFEQQLDIIQYLKERAGLCTQSYATQAMSHMGTMNNPCSRKANTPYYCRLCKSEHKSCTYCDNPDPKYEEFIRKYEGPKTVILK